MEDIEGNSTTLDHDPPPVDPAGAIIPVSVLNSSIPSLPVNINDPGYTTPTHSGKSDKSEYGSPRDSPDIVKDV